MDYVNMLDSDVAAFRRFSRFFTTLVGTLNEGFLKSKYSLPQVRLIYEIAAAPKAKPPSARDLGTALQMDTGYLSRLTSGLEKEGLISRAPCPDNAKRLALTLTEQGRKAFEALNAASAQEAATFLAPLSVRERRELTGAMDCIRRLLSGNSGDKIIVLRNPEPGDLGWIIHQQARLYAKEYGWDWTYEALVSEIIGQFVSSFDPASERCWIAERAGQVIGSVFVVREDEKTAKLRLLYVDESARGLGLGQRLVEECIRFAQSKGYSRMILWTNDVLVSARRIYQATGFELLEEERHRSFGKDLVGQVWGRDL